MKHARAYWHVLRATIIYFRNGRDTEYLRRSPAPKRRIP